MKTINYKRDTLEDVRSISESYRKGVIKLNISNCKVTPKQWRKHALPLLMIPNFVNGK